MSMAFSSTFAGAAPTGRKTTDIEEKMLNKKVALVVGASGIIGNAVLETLAQKADWTVRAVRRSLVPGVASFECDITDAQATANALREAADTTHVFYAALRMDSNPQREADINTAMLRNVLDGLKAAGAQVQRVVHFQGAKVYGPHLGPALAPYYEDDPRHVASNFYYEQEDLLRERASAGELEWSILRPDAVIGDIAGNPMNIAVTIGAYAALSRDAGVPLRFPGSVHTYRGVLGQLTDGRWLGRASEWAATAAAANNAAFNLVGEPFRWERIWQKVGAALDMEIAPPQPMSLADYLPEKAAVWERLARDNHLQPIPYEKLVNWRFGDIVFNMQWDMVSDMGKIRRAGFTEAVSTEDSLIAALKSLKAKRYIP
jgi:nucleoside-diphosphate-sugar epimerase